MAYFPFFIDIKDRKILIVGGGNVALRKAEKLLPFDAEITVVAPSICYEFSELPGVRLVWRNYRDSDLYNAFAVIAATNDRVLNSHIYELCTQLGILVNTVDDPENCGFYFPALVREGNVTIGISTGGTAPAFAKFVREKVEDELDSFTLGIGEILAGYRPRIKEMFVTEKQRAEAADAIIDLCLLDDVLPDDSDINDLLERIKTAHENKDRNAEKQAGSDTVGARRECDKTGVSRCGDRARAYYDKGRCDTR